MKPGVALRVTRAEEGLTAYGGLEKFRQFCRKLGIDAGIAEALAGLKKGPNVVYPLGTLCAALVPMAALGMGRVFHFERLVRQAKLDQSREMKRVHHVNCSFYM